MNDSDSVVTSFRISKRVLEHVKQISEIEGRSVSNVIQSIIEEGTGLCVLKTYASSEAIAESVRRTGSRLIENLKQRPTTTLQREVSPYGN